MAVFDWLAVMTRVVVWSSASTTPGGQYVMMGGMLLMQGWLADSSVSHPQVRLRRDRVYTFIYTICNSTGVVPTYSAFSGRGTGPIYLTNLRCTGSEATLLDCPTVSGRTCGHNEDAGVRCSLRTGDYLYTKWTTFTLTLL